MAGSVIFLNDHCFLMYVGHTLEYYWLSFLSVASHWTKVVHSVSTDHLFTRPSIPLHIPGIGGDGLASQTMHDVKPQSFLVCRYVCFVLGTGPV